MRDCVPEEPTVHVEYPGDLQGTKVTYLNGDTEELLVTPVAADLFLLEESSLLGHVSYHDIIRATIGNDGSLNLVEVVKPSALVTHTWILPSNVVESVGFRSILSDVLKVGGHWEQAFGGVVLVHLPPQEAEKVQERIELYRRTNEAPG